MLFGNCLLCFLALLQVFACYARFYGAPQSIMLVAIHTNLSLSHASSCCNHFSGAKYSNYSDYKGVVEAIID